MDPHTAPPITDEPKLVPVAANDSVPPARGRQADLWAMWMSLAAFGLALMAVIWFLAGFISSDPQFNPVFSAFLLSSFLGAFALGPPAICAIIARRAARGGLSRRGGWVVLALCLPWAALGVLLLSHSPLPVFVGALAVFLSGCLCFWAGVSLWLDRAGGAASQ